MRFPLSGSLGLEIDFVLRFNSADSPSGLAPQGSPPVQTAIFQGSGWPATKSKEDNGVMITLKPYPIESRSNRKEIPDISRRDHTTSETFMRALSSCFYLEALAGMSARRSRQN